MRNRLYDMFMEIVVTVLFVGMVILMPALTEFVAQLREGGGD